MKKTRDHKPKNFIACLSDVVRWHGDRLAIANDELRLTYRQLWELSGRMANKLTHCGATGESIVAVRVGKSAEYIAALIGVWRCRAAWVPVGSDLPQQRVEFLIADSGAEFLIDQLWIEELNTDVADVQFESPVEFSNDQIAYIIYTSGTTGQPKGVEITHRGLVPMLRQQVEAIGLTVDSRSLFLLSTDFDASVSDIGTALLAGASLWIDSALFANGILSVTPDQLLDYIAQNRITYVDIPPAVLAKMDPAKCPQSLETVLIGGEVCSPVVLRQWAEKVKLLNVYGPTEATVCTSIAVVDTDWSKPCIGVPLEGVEYIVEGSESDARMGGELLIGGRQLARGYRNRPVESNRKFVIREGQRVYRTGDVVEVDSQGHYVFVGRIDRQVKLRGHRIELEEIEQTLLMHPNVVHAAVIVSSLRGCSVKKIIAFVEVAGCDEGVSFASRLLMERSGLNRGVVPKVDFRFRESAARDATFAGAKGDKGSAIFKPADEIREEIANELRRHVAVRLPPYCHPTRFEVMRALPLTSSGKPDLCRLQKMAQTLTAKANPVESDDIESVLFYAFGKSLGHDQFDADSDFFAVGGDSMAALEVAAIVATVGVELYPHAVVQHRTIRKIVGFYHAQSDGEWMSAQFLCDDVDRLLQCERATQLTEVKEGQADSILLTGATGFLGTRLLHQLTANAGVKVICLVRGSDDAQARDRLLKALARNRVSISKQRLGNVTAVAGDVSLKQFGLSQSAYRSLARSINHVVHSAAEVNSAKTYSQLRPTNLLGTWEVVKFCSVGQLKKLDYVSTLSVFVSTDRFQGTMTEDDDLQETKRVYGGYAQSKFAAERLVRKATGLRLKESRIFRLGLLTADRATDVFPATDLLTLVVKGCWKLQAVPVLPTGLRLDVTPVDFAAQVLAWIVLSSEIGPVFHVAHPTGISAETLLNAIMETHSNCRRLEPAEFLARAKGLDLAPAISAACVALGSCDRSASRSHPVSLDLFQATATVFEMKRTKTCMEKAHLEFPKGNHSYLKKMIDAMIKPQGRQ